MEQGLPELTQELQERIQALARRRQEIQALHRYMQERWGEAPPIPQWEMPPGTDAQDEEEGV